MRVSVRLLFLATLAGSGCARPPIQRSLAIPTSAEALSLLGDTLWSLPVPPSQGPELVAQLSRARERLAKSPSDAGAALVVARRTAGLGRLREAVNLYTKAAELNPIDPRVPRYRGELLLQLRELELAQRDFQEAAQRLAGKELRPEFVEVEGGLLGSSLQFNIYHLLGITFYIKGEFPRARLALVEAVKTANNADDLAASMLWLFFSVRRLDAMDEARTLLGLVTDSMSVSTREPELTMLLAFRDGLSSDSLQLDLHRPFTTEREALLGYGLGFALLHLRRAEEAELMFEHVLTFSDWSALPVLAAEAELARIRKKPLAVGR